MTGEADETKRLGSMNPEEIAELKQLIEFLKENKIGEFDLERGDLKVRHQVCRAGAGADLSQTGTHAGSRRRRRLNPRRAFSRRRWRMRIRQAAAAAARQLLRRCAGG